MTKSLCSESCSHSLGPRRWIFIVGLLLPSLLACRQPPVVRIISPDRGRVEATVTSVTSGTVRAEREAELSFGVVGRIQEVRTDIGREVAAGEVLAAVENADLKTVLDNAVRQLERTKALVASRVLSASELEPFENEVDRARGNLEKSLIRAPFAGVVVERNLEVGQLSQVTTPLPSPLLRVVDREPRYVTTDIDEVDLPQIRLGAKAKVKILAVRREPFIGTVRKIIPYVTTTREQDRTTRIELDVESEGLSLPVGASADVEVLVDAHDDVLYLPARAVLGRSSSRHVFVFREGVAQKVPVVVGLANYDRAEITNGLLGSERLIFPSDEFELVDGMKIRIEEAEE